MQNSISSDPMLILSQGWFSKSDSLTAKGKLSTKSSLVRLLTILRSSDCSAELGFASGRDIEAGKEIRGTPLAMKYLKSEIHWHDVDDTMRLFHSTNSFQRGSSCNVSPHQCCLWFPHTSQKTEIEENGEDSTPASC
jgi:hypothetical protein